MFVWNGPKSTSETTRQLRIYIDPSIDRYFDPNSSNFKGRFGFSSLEVPFLGVLGILPAGYPSRSYEVLTGFGRCSDRDVFSTPPAESPTLQNHRIIREPMPNSHAGPGSAPRVPLLLEAVMLGLHWYGDLSFHVIGAKLDGNEKTPSGIIEIAKVGDPAFKLLNPLGTELTKPLRPEMQTILKMSLLAWRMSTVLACLSESARVHSINCITRPVTQGHDSLANLF